MRTENILNNEEFLGLNWNLREHEVALNELNPGEQGRVAYIITTQHLHLQKLYSLGMSPETEITLQQISPSYIIKVGETEIAVDKEVASQIYIRKI